MESCHEVSLLLSPFSLIVLHALLFRLFMSGFWWNYSIVSLYNRYRTRGLLGYVMYLFEFLVSYRSSFLLLTDDLNLFNLSIRCSINFRLHKSLHDSRESEVCIPLQILNFKSQLKSQVNAIRATTIIFMVERYYRWPQRSSLRSIERNVLNHWREICPWYFHRNNFCSFSNTAFKAWIWKHLPFISQRKLVSWRRWRSMSLHGTCKRILLKFGCLYNCHSD